jgi:hypothetical protein
MQDVLATKYHALGNLKIGMSIGSTELDVFERNKLYLLNSGMMALSEA